MNEHDEKAPLELFWCNVIIRRFLMNGPRCKYEI